MADLDIKNIWAKGKLQQMEALHVDVDEVVGKKSKNVLYWVKFILWIEFFINLIALPFLVLSIFNEELSTLESWTYGVTCVLIFLYFFYYQFLIRKINDFDYAGDVRSSLGKIYGYLKFYILHYRVVVWAIMPFSVFLSFFIAIEESARQGKEILYWSPQFWALAVMTAVFGLICSVVFHFLVNLIYGRKIKRLRGMIDELEG